jgi:hypothetical protein
MLLLLIPVIWLAVAASVVMLCRGAAAADATLVASAESAGAQSAQRQPSRSPLPTHHVWRRPGAHAASGASGARRSKSGAGF